MNLVTLVGAERLTSPETSERRAASRWSSGLHVITSRSLTHSFPAVLRDGLSPSRAGVARQHARVAQLGRALAVSSGSGSVGVATAMLSCEAADTLAERGRATAGVFPKRTSQRSVVRVHPLVLSRVGSSAGYLSPVGISCRSAGDNSPGGFQLMRLKPVLMPPVEFGVVLIPAFRTKRLLTKANERLVASRKRQSGTVPACRTFTGDWSSWSARRAHNPKVAGSSPASPTLSFTTPTATRRRSLRCEPVGVCLQRSDRGANPVSVGRDSDGRDLPETGSHWQKLCRDLDCWREPSPSGVKCR